MAMHETEMREDSRRTEHTDVPKVSVVVPVYNPGPGFDRCLASLRCQTLSDIEMIFVDDCGTDGAMDKACAAAAEDSRIRIITNPENLGRGQSCNRGIEAARGEYISFVDADDYVSPDFLELLYAKAHKENLDIAKGTACFERDEVPPQKRFQRHDAIRSGLAGHRPLYRLFHGQHWTGLYRRALLMESGARFGMSYTGQDVVFQLRVCHAAQTFGIEDRATYHYVFRKSSAVNTFTRQRLKNELETLKELMDYLVAHIGQDKNALEFASGKFGYLLSMHAYVAGIPELETAAAEYLADLRKQALRLPFIESMKAESIVIRSLVDDGANLSRASYSVPWEEPTTLARVDIVKRWADFALAHPELADEYGKDVQQVLKSAANAVVGEMQFPPRVEVKIFGTENSVLELCDISDKNAQVTTPVWLYKLRQPGTGYVIEPNRGQTEITLDFVCKTAGEFTATLRGADVRDANGKQMQKRVTYTGLTCNGELVFEDEKQVWHDQPYRYKRPVQAGDTVKLEISWIGEIPQESRRYVEQGDIAMRRGDWPEAAKHWALIRERFPEHPRGYVSGAAALKEQGGFAAAEALVLEGLKKFPKEMGLYNQYGDIAMRQRDWPEASKRWALMREKFPDRPIRRDYEFYRICPPEWYPEELKLWFKARTGVELNLENPQTFNEKIQWLKLYDSTPEKTRLADKYLVREYIKETIGEEYLIPLLGVWDNFDDIDFDALPDSFVLKANHGCTWNVIVQDKVFFDREAAKQNFDHWMKTNFALVAGLEFHYADIVPKIICEEYLENDGGNLRDYKIFCFNGIPVSILYIHERFPKLKGAFFDLQWNKLPYIYNMEITDCIIEKPDNLDLMISFANHLAGPFAHVRIDFYVLNNSDLKFGEMTFTSASGICKWDPVQQDLFYGNMLTLPKQKYPLPTKSFEERGVQPLPENFHRQETDIRKKL